MKLHHPMRYALACLLAGHVVVSTAVTMAAPVIISSQEDWDGVNNPHAADGVTLSGAGTEADPAVYTIPLGMTIPSSGLLRMPPAGGTDRSIKLVFASGNLDMQAGAVINIGRLNRNDRQICVLDLGGGSITGAGRIVGLLQSADSPRVLTISNATDVTLTEIDLHVVNCNNSGRHLRIVATGRVAVGNIDNADKDPGGNNSSNVEITAGVIELGGVDTRALRSDGNAANGHVVLQALGPPAFDPNTADGNRYTNKLVLSGLINTAGAGPNGGNVTLRGVRVLLQPGFALSKAANGTLALEAGVIRAGVSAGDLYSDAAGSGLTAAHLVQWAGDPSPAFTVNPIVKPNGQVDQPYTGTLTNVAVDPDGDPLTFAKVSGPAWLNVAPDGTLSGTPGAGDVLTNIWTVSVSDGTSGDTATLIIYVGGSPRFLTDPIVKMPAKEGLNYAVAAASLAADAMDPDGDPLTFAKAGGPAWLQVDASGALSGTPTAADVGLNAWTVTVTDGTYTNQATLQITVVAAGSPVTVSTTEAWDGLQNLHAGEGVTLSGAGTEADPAVYTIPSGLAITATGALQMPPAVGGDRSIVFLFASGDLHIEAGGMLNVGRLNRNGRQICVLDLGGGSITGAGRIVGLLQSADSPRVLTIQNVTDVTLAEIDLHVVNANTSGRHLRITADGHVNIGRVDNSDQDPFGNDSSDVEIEASVIDIGSVDTRAMRADGTSRNGHIILQALQAPVFDPNQADFNTFNNRLTVTGVVQTAGAGTMGGNVTLQGVVVRLQPGFSLLKPAPATLTLEAGVVRANATAADLFDDAAGSGLSAAHSVQWSGDANHPPVAVDQHLGTVLNVPTSVPFVKLLTGCSDPDGDPLAVSGVSATSTNGGAVSLGSNAVLYTPPANYVGSDAFTYTISDGRGGTDSAFVLVTITNGQSQNITGWGYDALNRTMTLNFAGIPGYTYRVQFTESLTPPIDWTDFATNTAPPHGLFSVTDTNAGAGNRFYRTVYP